MNDLTTGSPLKKIIMMSIPIMLGSLFQQLYSAVDAVIVGRYLGATALAAVGSTSTLYYMIMWSVNGMSGGYAVVVAQFFGAKDYQKLKKSIGIAIELALTFTIIATIFSTAIIKKALIFMNTPDEIFEDAYSYVIVILAGLITMMFYNIFSAILRAIGDSKTPFFFLVLTSILNVGLDILFIRNFEMGTRGAAVATVISQGVSALMCGVFIWFKYPILIPGKRDFIFDKDIAWRLLRLGVPSGAMGTLTASGVIVLQYAVNSYGANAVAAYTVATKVEQFCNMPLGAYSMTITNFAGQNMGAKKYNNLSKGINSGIMLSVATAAIIGTVVYTFAEPICGIFMDASQNQEVIGLALRYVHTVAPMLAIYGLMNMLRYSMQGVGDPFAPLINAIVETLSRIVWTAYLVKHVNFTLLCFANPSTWGFAALIIGVLFIRKMRKIRGMAILEGNNVKEGIS